MKHSFKFLFFLLALAMAIPPAWATTTDVITASDLAATSTTYTVTSTPVVKGSGAAYLAKSALKSSAIAISSSSEGFVATSASGGTAKSITITFSSGQSGTRTIQVYGKNEAYNTTDVYYGASTRGTLITSINSYSQNESQVSLTGDYPFIAIRSSSGEAIIDQIEIEWEGVGPTLEVSGITDNALTINDSGSNNSFSVTGSGLIDNVGLSRSSSSITPSLSTTVGTAVNNDNGNWYFIHNDGSLTGAVTATYEGRELTATDIFTLGTDKNNNGEDITIPVEVTYQPNIYVIGNFGNAGWQYGDGSHPMTYSKDGNTITYTATLENVPANSYIMFTRKTGETYYWEGDYNRLFFGAQTDGGDWGYGTNTSGNLDTDPTDEYPVKYHPIYFSEAGNYTITINAAAKTFSITKVLPQVATPVISPESGNFTETQQVTITCETSGATIYYTTDGSAPTTSSTVYSAPFTVSETTTVKAIAVLNGYTDSEVAEATYTKVLPSNDITVPPNSSNQNNYVPFYGYYHDTQNTTCQVIYPASMLNDLDEKTITGVKFYTVDGVKFYGGENTITMGLTDETTLTSANTMTISGPTVTTTFVHQSGTTLTEVELTFDPGLEYTAGKNLIIQTVVTTAGTCDSYNNYTNFVGANQNYNCSSYKGGSYANGLLQFLPKATFTYESAMAKVATPTFSPAAGTYTDAQQVTIACETSGATIYYTTDGTTPTTSSTVYSSAVNVAADMTLKAIAVLNGYTDSEVATATYTIETPAQDYDVSVSPNGGTIDFGTVDYEANATKSKTITVKNIGLNAVTPSLSALTAPFSTDYVPASLASGESTTITITFAPTAEGTFNQDATLTFGRGIEARNFTLTGKGGKYNENDHSALYDYTYKWLPQGATDSIESSLLEPATDPDQIIGMLRAIYMNKNIPGIKVRGYEDPVAYEATPSYNRYPNIYPPVAYPAVGTIVQENGNLVYSDAYGWNIPTNKPYGDITGSTYNYKYFDPTEYEPYQEGLTLILIEIKDGVNDVQGTSSYYGVTSGSLRDKVAHTFKSARILTNWKESGSGEEAGTLFKIDADKLNRYFIIGKGKPRLADHSNNNGDWECYYPSLRWKKNYNPFASSSSTTFTDDGLSGQGVMAPFLHMFEEFSPNLGNSSSDPQTDQYHKLINMETFNVYHDCLSVAFIGGHHEFNMYGTESLSEDCQDIRDMMFFVPKYRMKYWFNGTGITERRDWATLFFNYHPDHLPKMGLYVIRQNEITGDKQANADVYDLNLSWESNLLDFLPGAEAMYQLFRVVTDESGNKTYELVTTLDPNETTYVDHVPMAQHGQQVTYVVQGQDQTKFLSLQMSNEESYIIPGLDKSEIFTLSARFDHYSRFDPLTESNYYANQLKVVNNMGTNIKGAYMGNGAKFTFMRGTVNGNDTTWVAVAEATSNGNGSLAINTDLPSQNRSGLYTHNNVDWIKMDNPSTVSYTVDGSDNVTFQDFNLYDNFFESVAQNSHPGFYLYKVEFEAPAGTTIQGTQGNKAHSNRIGVAIHKTDMNVLGYSKSDIDLDKNHVLDATTRPITEQVTYSSKTDILRYDLYRWNENDEGLGYIIDFANSTFNPSTGAVSEQDEAPTGIAGNQAGEYTISMDGENQNENNVTIAQGETKWATFVDNAVQDVAGMYTYAPVVETFTSRGDYNTYGAPVQLSGVAKIAAEVMDDYVMSVLPRQGSTDNGVWTVNNKQYCHYTVKLKLSELQIPGDEANQLKDYDLYKIRVWRQVPADLVSEQVYKEGDKRNRNERIENVVTVNGESFVEFLMEEKNNDTFDKTAVINEASNVGGNVLGNSSVRNSLCGYDWTPGTQEVMATFGAQKLRQTADETGVIEELPMKFIVRAYYTRTANIDQTAPTTPVGYHAPRRGVDLAEDGKYYIAETTLDFTFTTQNLDEHTSIPSVIVDRQVTSVTYYNMMGQQDDKPFEGVNIVVTRYNDGTTTTAKVLK